MVVTVAQSGELKRMSGEDEKRVYGVANWHILFLVEYKEQMVLQILF